MQRDLGNKKTVCITADVMKAIADYNCFLLGIMKHKYYKEQQYNY